MRLATGVTLALVAVSCGSSSDEPVATSPAPSPTTGPAATSAPVVTGPLELLIESGGGPSSGPIPLTVSVVNRTEDTVTVVRPIFISNFISLRIHDSSGERMRFFGPHRELAPLSDGGFATLASGEGTAHEFDLHGGFDLSPGTYTVTAEYFNPSGGSHEGSRALVFELGEGPVSAEITFEVTP